MISVRFWQNCASAILTTRCSHIQPPARQQQHQHELADTPHRPRRVQSPARERTKSSKAAIRSSSEFATWVTIRIVPFSNVLETACSEEARAHSQVNQSTPCCCVCDSRTSQRYSHSSRTVVQQHTQSSEQTGLCQDMSSSVEQRWTIRTSLRARFLTVCTRSLYVDSLSTVAGAWGLGLLKPDCRIAPTQHTGKPQCHHAVSPCSVTMQCHQAGNMLLSRKNRLRWPPGAT